MHQDMFTAVIATNTEQLKGLVSECQTTSITCTTHSKQQLGLQSITQGGPCSSFIGQPTQRSSGIASLQTVLTQADYTEQHATGRNGWHFEKDANHSHKACAESIASPSGGGTCSGRNRWQFAKHAIRGHKACAESIASPSAE